MSNFSSSVIKRLERASWEVFGLSKITSADDFKRLKTWLKVNCSGDFYITAIKESIGSRKITIATLVRIKEDTDVMLFRLQWAGYE